MLNEYTEIPKVRMALVEPSFFYEPEKDRKVNFETMRRLTFGLTANWVLNLVAHFDEPDVAKLVADCRLFGIHFMRTNLVRDVEGFKKVAHICEIGYTPQLLKTLPVNFLLRQPPSAKVMLEVLCHFSQCIEPFNPENYYKAVEHYGP